MKTLSTVLCLGVVIMVVLFLWNATSPRPNVPTTHSSIPYVATRNDAVQDMLWIANVGKDDVVYDLGSGDGRIVIAAVRDFGARRAVGVESDPERLQKSLENAKSAGISNRVRLISGDLFTTDFRQASVVTLFLGHTPNIKLRPMLFRMLKPGTRIVSHQYGMGEWRSDKILTVRTSYLGMWGTVGNPFMDNSQVPDYTGNERRLGSNDTILMWVIPAPVAGIWRGKIETTQGQQDCQLIFHQRLSEVTGTFQISGQDNRTGRGHVDLWGDHVRFEFMPDRMPNGRFQLRFDGHVHRNTMEGTLAVEEQGQIREHSWKAQRDTADFTGTWEWPCTTGPRSVRLRIEQSEGTLFATYLDRGQEITITDFYDHKGGFYFTLLIGRENDELVITDDTGWLIGEALLDQGVLKGKLRFYPYGDRSGVSSESSGSKPIIQDWTPHLITP